MGIQLFELRRELKRNRFYHDGLVRAVAGKIVNILKESAFFNVPPNYDRYVANSLLLGVLMKMIESKGVKFSRYCMDFFKTS